MFGISTNQGIKRLLGCLVVSFFMFSCGNDLSILMPQGPKGDKGDLGKSAYQEWKESVEKGTINDWSGGKDVADFFTYLKGKDGSSGQSAYDLWKDQVLKGEIKDKLGKVWANNEIEISDFWFYLSGSNGLNSYQVWVSEVKAGTLANPHGQFGVWPVGEIAMEDYWRYLTGAAGAKGETGNDGLSAYQIWVEKVNEGNLPNPNGQLGTWPAADNSMLDFWIYLTGLNGKDGVDGAKGDEGQIGEDGLSAYELWVTAVTTPPGLLNPHKDDGSNWDVGKTKLEHFWEYLRGRDGTWFIKDKVNVITEEVTRINDIAEYVNPADGSVKYTVYDKTGTPVGAGVIVKSLLPSNPTKEFITDANGQFTVMNTELPGAAKNDFTCEVKLAGEAAFENTADNTKVPASVEVRLRTNQPYLNTTYGHALMIVNCFVDRKVGTAGEWEQIPVSSKALMQKLNVFMLQGDNDPKATKSLLYTAVEMNVSQTIPVNVRRMVEPYAFVKNYCDASIASDNPYVTVYNPANNGKQFNASGTYKFWIWDGNKHYCGIQLDSYYGQSPFAPSVIELAPVQFTPLIKNLVAKSIDDDAVYNLNFNFDVADEYGYYKSGLNKDLIFQKKFEVVDKVTYNFYHPIPSTTSDTEGIFTSYFTYNNNSNIHAYNNPATINKPGVLIPYIKAPARVDLQTSYQFQPLHTIGELQKVGNEYRIILKDGFNDVNGARYISIDVQP